MTELSPTKRLRELIKQIRGHFEALESVVPWERFIAGSFSKDTLGILRQIVPPLVDDYQSISELLRQRVRTSGRLTGLRPEEQRYFSEVIEPRTSVLKGLSLWSLLNEFDDDGRILKRDLAEKKDTVSIAYLEQIARAIDIGLFRIEENEDELSDYEWFHDIDLEGARELVDSDLFRPDEWHENADRVRPALLGKHPGIPNSLRVRLDDLYRSYVFGQYLSATAMARSVMEYTLGTWVERHGHIARELTLEELIDVVTEKNPALSKGRLDIVRLNGNAIMHPEARVHDNVVEFPPSEGSCRRCMKIVVEVIEALQKELG